MVTQLRTPVLTRFAAEKGAARERLTPMPNVNDDEALWTAVDVGNLLSASRSWVYSQVATGAIPYVRIVGLVRFRPSEIRAWAGVK